MIFFKTWHFFCAFSVTFHDFAIIVTYHSNVFHQVQHSVVFHFIYIIMYVYII